MSFLCGFKSYLCTQFSRKKPLPSVCTPISTFIIALQALVTHSRPLMLYDAVSGFHPVYDISTFIEIINFSEIDFVSSFRILVFECSTNPKVEFTASALIKTLFYSIPTLFITFDAMWQRTALKIRYTETRPGWLA